MPNFLTSMFRSTPKFVAGHKVASAKTVKEVLGEAFDYEGSVRANSAFCKKLLIWCAHEFSTENVVFLLMCEKYKKAPSTELFNVIYSDFIDPKNAGSINIAGKAALALTTLWNLGNPGASSVVFRDAISDTKLNLTDSTDRLKMADFATAFTLTDPAKKRNFESAMAYLKAQQIYLL